MNSAGTLDRTLTDVISENYNSLIQTTKDKVNKVVKTYQGVKNNLSKTLSDGFKKIGYQTLGEQAQTALGYNSIDDVEDIKVEQKSFLENVCQSTISPITDFFQIGRVAGNKKVLVNNALSAIKKYSKESNRKVTGSEAADIIEQYTGSSEVAKEATKQIVSSEDFSYVDDSEIKSKNVTTYGPLSIYKAEGETKLAKVLDWTKKNLLTMGSETKTLTLPAIYSSGGLGSLGHYFIGRAIVGAEVGTVVGAANGLKDKVKEKCGTNKVTEFLDQNLTQLEMALYFAHIGDWELAGLSASGAVANTVEKKTKNDLLSKLAGCIAKGSEVVSYGVFGSRALDSVLAGKEIPSVVGNLFKFYTHVSSGDNVPAVSLETDILTKTNIDKNELTDAKVQQIKELYGMAEPVKRESVVPQELSEAEVMHIKQLYGLGENVNAKVSNHNEPNLQKGSNQDGNGNNDDPGFIEVDGDRDHELKLKEYVLDFNQAKTKEEFSQINISAFDYFEKNRKVMNDSIESSFIDFGKKVFLASKLDESSSKFSQALLLPENVNYSHLIQSYESNQKYLEDLLNSRDDLDEDIKQITDTYNIFKVLENVSSEKHQSFIESAQLINSSRNVLDNKGFDNFMFELFQAGVLGKDWFMKDSLTIKKLKYFDEMFTYFGEELTKLPELKEYSVFSETYEKLQQVHKIVTGTNVANLPVDQLSTPEYDLLNVKLDLERISNRSLTYLRRGIDSSHDFVRIVLLPNIANYELNNSDTLQENIELNIAKLYATEEIKSKVKSELGDLDMPISEIKTNRNISLDRVYKETQPITLEELINKRANKHLGNLSQGNFSFFSRVYYSLNKLNLGLDNAELDKLHYELSDFFNTVMDAPELSKVKPKISGTNGVIDTVEEYAESIKAIEDVTHEVHKHSKSFTNLAKDTIFSTNLGQLSLFGNLLGIPNTFELLKGLRTVRNFERNDYDPIKTVKSVLIDDPIRSAQAILKIPSKLKHMVFDNESYSLNGVPLTTLDSSEGAKIVGINLLDVVSQMYDKKSLTMANSLISTYVSGTMHRDYLDWYVGHIENSDNLEDILKRLL